MAPVCIGHRGQSSRRTRFSNPCERTLGTLRREAQEHERNAEAGSPLVFVQPYARFDRNLAFLDPE
jgi:hypothetical protein